MQVDILHELGQGFLIALSPSMLMYSSIGAVLGTAIGVLPGIGSAGALALMLPIVTSLNPVGAIIMLAATYTGVMYGGGVSSILLNTPGDTSAVIVCLDGHQMAKQGRAGPALCISAISSYVAGTVSVLGMMLIGPLISRIALTFSPPEYFALMLFGLTAVSSLAGDSLLKAFMSVCVGLMLATVGVDVAGVPRFVFGIPDLLSGIQFLSITLGLFAISEVLIGVRNIRQGDVPELIKHRLFISFREIRECIGSIVRGGILGFFVGVLPGAGAGIASFLAYSLETQVSRHPERFGKGEIRGVSAPEAANNAASAGAMVPMLTLGIPGSATTAVMLGAFVMLDITPGPLLFSQRPDLVWGLIAALYIGNIMLLILNLPLVNLFIRILYLPMRMLIPIIVVIAAAGIFSVNYSILDLFELCFFGLLGDYMRRYGYPLAPVILGFVLGGRMEEAFRQSMIMHQGNILEIIERPIVSVFLLLSVASLVLPPLIRMRSRRGLISGEAPEALPMEE